MLYLSKTECQQLNNAILLTNTISNCDEMRKQILEELSSLIPYDKADFYLNDNKDDYLLCNPISIGVDKEFLRNYEEYYEQKDYVRWIFNCKESIVYRETDIIDNNYRVKTEFFNDYLIPMGVYYPMGASICNDEKFLGTITLFRTKESGDFSEKDLFVLELLNAHLSRRLTKEILSLKMTLNIRLIKKYNLTNKEHEIVSLIIDGKSNQEICNQMYITISTVKRHIYNVYKKLNVNSRTQLINKLIS